MIAAGFFQVQWSARDAGQRFCHYRANLDESDCGWSTGQTS
jgi:hypothetical protein